MIKTQKTDLPMGLRKFLWVVQEETVKRPEGMDKGRWKGILRWYKKRITSSERCPQGDLDDSIRDNFERPEEQ